MTGASPMISLRRAGTREHTLLAWEKVAGRDHPNTLATRVNLAVVLRLRGHPDAAREDGRGVLAGLPSRLPRTIRARCWSHAPISPAI